MSHTVNPIDSNKSVYESCEAFENAIEKKHPAVALQNDFDIHSLEKFAPQRIRMRGEYTASNLESYAQYISVNAETGCTIFIRNASSDALKATAILNLGTPDKPGHTDNIATLFLASSPFYNSFKSQEGVKKSQKEFVNWAEEWHESLTFFKDGEVIPTKHAINALRAIKVETTKRYESEAHDLKESRSAFEEVLASGKDGYIPNQIEFALYPYEGFELRVIRSRLSVITIDEKDIYIQRKTPSIESIQEEIAKEFAQKVTQAIKDKGNWPVLLGEYKSR